MNEREEIEFKDVMAFCCLLLIEREFIVDLRAQMKILKRSIEKDMSGWIKVQPEEVLCLFADAAP